MTANRGCASGGVCEVSDGLALGYPVLRVAAGSTRAAAQPGSVPARPPARAVAAMVATGSEDDLIWTVVARSASNRSETWRDADAPRVVTMLINAALVATSAIDIRVRAGCSRSDVAASAS